MKKKPQNFVDVIHEIYEDLKGRERQLADFILEAPGDISMYPATELARLVNASNSTVTRFVQKCGFANYEQMRIAAREARHWGSPPFIVSRDFKIKGVFNYLKAFQDSESQALYRSLAALGPESLEELSTALLDARVLGFMGFRNSHYFAGYARWQFIQFREHTRLIPGAGETIAEHITDLNQDDIIMVIGVRRIIGNLKRYLKALKEKGVRVLLLTDPSARVTPKYVTWTIICHVENEFIFDSYAGILGVIRILAYETFKKSGTTGQKHLKQIESNHEILSEFEQQF